MKQKISGYEIEGELGRGAMGAVYRARSEGGQAVALKVLLGGKELDVARFQREVEIVRSLEHSAVVRVFGSGQLQSGGCYLAMELHSSGSLHDLIRYGAVPALKAARLMLEVARGLAYAHSRGVLHWDLKPHNILLSEDGRAVITDFGLARSASPSALTVSGELIGTVAYMAPEQANGAKASARTDVYSLGATLFELITGRAPFAGETDFATLKAVLTQRPPRPSEFDPSVDPTLEAICVRCMEAEPADRYGTADEVGDALEEFLEGWADDRRRPKWLLGVAASVVVISALGAGFAWQSGASQAASPPPAPPAPVEPSPEIPSPKEPPAAPPEPVPEDPPEQELSRSWRRIEIRLPPARGAGAMATDTRRGAVVLFGGRQQTPRGGLWLNDTWEFEGGKWVLRATPIAPPARRTHRLVYDRLRKVVVLFGGANSEACLSDTWEWDGIRWVEYQTLRAPPARSHHGMAYDAKRGKVVVFGGRAPSGQILGDTWTYDGARWFQEHPDVSPTPRRNHAMAFDNERGVIVLFGEMESEETWEWDGVTWRRVEVSESPGPRRIPGALVWDPRRLEVVLFGGNLGRVLQNDTWTYDGQRWAKVQTAGDAPAPRDWQHMAFDPLRESILLLGGETESLGRSHMLTDFWEF